MAEAIIFVPCPDRSSPRHVVNYGALAVATALHSHGVKVRYIDGSRGRLSDVCRHIESELADCVFFGVSSFTAQVGEAAAVSDFVKSVRPDLPVIWGGIHASLLPEETVSDPSVDYVCVGEGDYTIVQFYDQLASGNPDMSQVNNLVYYRGDELVRTPVGPFYDMQQQTHLAWDLLDLPKYVVHNRYDGNCPSLGIPVARGCPHRCSFCVNVALKDLGYTHYRYRRPEHVEADLAYLKDRLGIGFSFIRDEVFFVNTDYSRSIAGVFARQGILWGANLRANYFKPGRLTEEFLREMRGLGMLNGAMGVESGSPRILADVVHKDITLEQVHHAMATMSAAGIRPFVSFVIGFPTETEAETRQTIDLAVALKRLNPATVVAGIYLLRPYPGAPIYDLCLEHGLTAPGSLREWGTLELTRQGGFEAGRMPWLRDRDGLYAVSEYTTTSLLDLDRSAGFLLNVLILLARARRVLGFYGLAWELAIQRHVRAASFRFRAIRRRLLGR